MRHALTFALATLVLSMGLAGAGFAAPATGAAAADAEGRYQALLAAARASPATADWGQLRLAYAERPGFNVFAQSIAKRQMFDAANANNCPEALKAARLVIGEAYVDPDAHFVAAFCEDAAGDSDGAKLDRTVGAGLIKSIQTGDGLAPATAFTVIDIDEEYALMRALGAKVQDQSLVRQGGHAYDRLEALGPDGRKLAYYFAVDRILAAESAALTPGAVTEGGPPSHTP